VHGLGEHLTSPAKDNSHEVFGALYEECERDINFAPPDFR